MASYRELYVQKKEYVQKKICLNFLRQPIEYALVLYFLFAFLGGRHTKMPSQSAGMTDILTNLHNTIKCCARNICTVP